MDRHPVTPAPDSSDSQDTPVSATPGTPEDDAAKQAAIDATLVEQVRAGSEDALAQLYDRHATTVYSIAIGLLRDQSRAEDVTHDVFITLWQHPDRYNPAVGRFAPWFYRVARNRTIDVLRQRRREVNPAESEVFEATLADSGPSPSEVILSQADAQRVRQALTRLSDDQRRLIELAYFSGMTQSEMAEKLDIPLGTVKTRVRTGLRRLRAILEAEEE